MFAVDGGGGALSKFSWGGGGGALLPVRK